MFPRPEPPLRLHACSATSPGLGRRCAECLCRSELFRDVSTAITSVPPSDTATNNAARPTPPNPDYITLSCRLTWFRGVEHAPPSVSYLGGAQPSTAATFRGTRHRPGNHRFVDPPRLGAKADTYPVMVYSVPSRCSSRRRRFTIIRAFVWFVELAYKRCDISGLTPEM